MDGVGFVRVPPSSRYHGRRSTRAGLNSWFVKVIIPAIFKPDKLSSHGGVVSHKDGGFASPLVP
jgi:hypothetical protein